MPADHGTPNTGDERDREVESILNRIIDAASCAGADGVLPAGTVRVECLRATYALKAACGTVAVEDVREWLYDRARAETRHGFAEGGAALAEAAGAVLARFGVSGRTERIHDQATKEDR